MSMASHHDILEEALALPLDERAQMVFELLKSLEPQEAGAEVAWLQEIERRLREVDAGSAQLEDWSAVRERLLHRWTPPKAD